MKLREPIELELINPAVVDQWSCPACYADLDTVRPCIVECGSCGHRLRLTRDTQPICRSEVLLPGSPEDE